MKLEQTIAVFKSVIIVLFSSEWASQTSMLLFYDPHYPSEVFSVVDARDKNFVRYSADNNTPTKRIIASEVCCFPVSNPRVGCRMPTTS